MPHLPSSAGPGDSGSEAPLEAPLTGCRLGQGGLCEQPGKTKLSFPRPSHLGKLLRNFPKQGSNS